MIKAVSDGQALWHARDAGAPGRGLSPDRHRAPPPVAAARVSSVADQRNAGTGGGVVPTPPDDLRRRVEESLRRQGFSLGDDGSLTLIDAGKDAIRALHREAVHARLARAREGLERHEDRLMGYLADGDQVEPKAIRPILREVQPKSEDELLFRYARLHWSIPVSAGYGRRLRFVVFDEANGKLMGIFGLGDPVFALGPRDRWVGWDRETRAARLRHVMDAFVVGAVPPYSSLLVGKLIGMLMASKEVGEAFSRKYSVGETLIRGRPSDGRLGLVTTTSALGRSSMYNRLTFNGQKLFISAGFTLGSGEFHLSNGVYNDLRALADELGEPTAKNPRWGVGWRSRREVVRRVLPRLGLSRELVYHGVRREVFVVPLAVNTREFLRGEDEALIGAQPPALEMFEHFRLRWLLPRAERDLTFRAHHAASLRLWREGVVDVKESARAREP